MVNVLQRLIQFLPLEKPVDKCEQPLRIGLLGASQVSRTTANKPPAPLRCTHKQLGNTCPEV